MEDPRVDGSDREDHDDWDAHLKWKEITGQLDGYMEGNAIYCSQFELFKRRRAGVKPLVDRLWVRIITDFLFWLGMLFTGPIGFLTYCMAQKDPQKPYLMFLYRKYRLMFALGCLTTCGSAGIICILFGSHHSASFFFSYAALYILMKYIFPLYDMRDRSWKCLAYIFQLNVAHITGTTSSWFLILVCLITGVFGTFLQYLIESNSSNVFDFLGNFFGLASAFYSGTIVLTRLLVRTDVALDQAMPRDIEARQILNLLRKPEVWEALMMEHKLHEEHTL